LCGWGLLALTSFAAEAQISCGKTRFYYIHNRAKVFETQDYCVDKKSGALFNDVCKDRACLAQFKETYDELLEGKKPGFGTSGFWVCHNLGGSPQIIKVLGDGSALTTMDRCMLKNGGVIDTVSLELYFKNKT
jgi:hypothetical protein